MRLRAARDSEPRADAIGIDDPRGSAGSPSSLAGAAAGLAGGLYAFSRGLGRSDPARHPDLGRRPHHDAARRHPDHCGAAGGRGGPAGAARPAHAAHVPTGGCFLGLSIIAMVLIFPRGPRGQRGGLWQDRRGRGAGMSLLAVEDLNKAFGGVVAARGRVLRARAGRDARAHRPERRRQIDGLQHDRRPAPAGSRHGAASTARDITGLRPASASGMGIGRTFQVAQTFASMTVRRERPDGAHQPAGESRRSGIRPGRRHREAALALLDRVGMARGRRPALLDPGLRRREAGRARDRAGGRAPKLLLMDEPTAGMAPRERAALMELTAAIAADDAASACCSPSTTWTWCSATRTACSCCCGARSSPRARRTRSGPIRRCGRPISATRRPWRLEPWEPA